MRKISAEKKNQHHYCYKVGHSAGLQLIDKATYIARLVKTTETGIHFSLHMQKVNYDFKLGIGIY